MLEESFWFHTNDQHELFVKHWQHTSSPKAIIQIAHGMVEHIERYHEFATYLTEQGFTVYGHDHRGHGKTGENANSLGYLAEENGFDRVVQDCIELTEMIEKKYPQTPIFLMGHSMGSFICRRYMMLAPNHLAGAILIGTGFQPSGLLKVAKQMAKTVGYFKGRNTEAKLMNKLTFFGYNKHTDNQTVFDWICSDQQEVEKYTEDKWCGFTPTNQFFYDLYTGLQWIQSKDKTANIPKDLPLFFVSGKEDPVGQYGEGVQKAVAFYRSIDMENVNYHLYEKGRHEILNETNKKEVFHDIVTWIRKQMACHNFTQSL
ncbi:Lysophospholipase, alpha-beta hydrolase superfamily [Gracilibacillus orientalis]|uniref:Lysophospholipase, alpha-beta hydrolase superfamily n=1 Tax=Gracilibacillus orientalis TaxID=334253 RepID=A0A1I4P226_9BACI|nr:alpha/beta hydrolase [Gracilibacillus orientalis]SFM21590.1 Lysophospholipase, alpha-beta hydrolase superfamily [Gracilibacillus orientalis]